MANSLHLIYFIMASLNIYSINANGMRNIDKVKNVFGLMNEWNCDILLLQETYWDEEIIETIRALWNGIVYFSNNNDVNRHCGVAALVNNRLKENVSLVNKDNDGRLININYTTEENNFNIISLYAPNNNVERVKFFNDLYDYIDDVPTIIGGDMNTTFTQKDRANTIHINDRACYTLKKLCNDKIMYDVWRKRNPESQTYSWKRLINNNLKMSRIDYFLVPECLSPNIKYVQYKHTTISDHNFVYMNISFEKMERGPGVWVLNNKFLQEDEFTNKIHNLLTHGLQDPLYDTNIMMWWDIIKYKIRKISQLYGKCRNKKQRERYNKIQRQMDSYTELIANGHDFNLNKYENLKNELATIEYEKCQAAILRSKAYWAVESDKNTKYFLNLEKYKQNLKCVSEIIRDDGVIVNDTVSILTEEYNFYNELYNSVQVDNINVENFISVITPDLNDTDRQLCDENISLDEITEALTSMAKNKSPGSDGITVEFYQHFWHLLKNILFKLFKAIEKENIMTRTMRHGIISLIYKKGDKRQLKNWRPISLLNVDYKMLARVMANRLKYVLPNIISASQTCCVAGRDISENISSIRDVIDMVEDNNSEGYVVSVDQMKAFDRVSHVYLFKVLEKFGFGPNFIKWIKIFYNEIFSAVKCNGFLTNYFSVTNSVRQGCPISAMLYIICAEPLSRTISSHTSIRGIHIPHTDKHSLVFQHADDTTCTVSDRKSIETLLNVFEDYGKASGAKINKNKTEIMTIGSGKLGSLHLESIGVSKCDETMKILGVHLGKDKKLCEIKNWEEKISKIKKVLNLWKQRKLNITGRATVVSTLLLSRLWYLAMVQPIPKWIVAEIKTACMQFIWMKKSYPVKYNTIIGHKDMGGLNIPDIESKMKAFRMKYLVRFVDNSHESTWKYTLFQFLCTATGMKLKCFSDFIFLKFPNSVLSRLPDVYREMFCTLNELHQYIECDYSLTTILNQPLFYNKRICYKGRPLSLDFFIKSGLYILRDITYEVVPGFLPVKALKEIILDQCPDISEYTIEKAFIVIKSSIPFEWYTKITKYITDNEIIQPNFVLVKPPKIHVLSQCSTSVFYQTLIQEKFEIATSNIFWNSVFPNINLSKFSELIHTGGKCPDMIENDFKIFHNIIYTNEKLSKYGLIDSNKCLFCLNEVEDLLHLFVKCRRLAEFISFIQYHIENLTRKLPNDFINGINFDKMFILGFEHNMKNVNFYLLNNVLSHARLCITKTRHLYIQNNKKVDLIQFFKYSFERYIGYIYHYHKEHKRIGVFNKYFLYENYLIKDEDHLKFQW